jgi:hypothetical protein
MKIRRIVLLTLTAVGLTVVAQVHHIGKSLALYAGQQGPPNAPPPTAAPSEPIILHSVPQRMPPDFEGTTEQMAPRRRFDAVKTRKDAEQLAALANKLPSEVDQVSKGMIPKDLDQRLKDIQKLAKRLRGEISP